MSGSTRSPKARESGGAPARRRFRVILADDEPLARQDLERLLAEDEELELVASCRDGREARQAIASHRPDIALLDVRMPAPDGLELARELSRTLESGTGEGRTAPTGPVAPLLIFITAFDEHAVAAFERQAVDYLLKPFSRERLRHALGRAKQRLRETELSRLGEQTLRAASLGASPSGSTPDPGGERSRPRALAVTRGDRTLIVEIASIDWIEAADYYARIHAGPEHYLLRRSLQRLTEELGDGFVRVHRSAVVNVSRVAELRRLGPDDQQVVLSDGTEVPLSRRGREALNRALGIGS